MRPSLDAKKGIDRGAVVRREEPTFDGLEPEGVAKAVRPDVAARTVSGASGGERVAGERLAVEREAEDLAEQLIELLARACVPAVADADEQRVADDLATADLVSSFCLEVGEDVGECLLPRRLEAEGSRLRSEADDVVSKEVAGPLVRVRDENEAVSRIEADACQACLPRAGGRLL